MWVPLIHGKIQACPSQQKEFQLVQKPNAVISGFWSTNINGLFSVALLSVTQSLRLAAGALQVQVQLQHLLFLCPCTSYLTSLSLSFFTWKWSYQEECMQWVLKKWRQFFECYRQMGAAAEVPTVSPLSALNTTHCWPALASSPQSSYGSAWLMLFELLHLPF